MTYRVALDDKEGSEKGKMAEILMEAARCGTASIGLRRGQAGQKSPDHIPCRSRNGPGAGARRQVRLGCQAAAQYVTHKKNEEQITKLSH